MNRPVQRCRRRKQCRSQFPSTESLKGPITWTGSSTIRLVHGPDRLDAVTHSKLTFAEVALALILGVVSLDTLFAPSRTYTRKFFHLSYPTQTPGTYKQGPDDLYYILAWVVTFTALRAISIEWILQPLAECFGVVQKNRQRIAEQGWLVMYCGTFWGLGMVCCSHRAAHSGWSLTRCHRSTFGSTRLTGSTTRLYGGRGLPERCQDHSSGTTWFNWPFGSNKSSSSISKNAAKIITRC